MTITQAIILGIVQGLTEFLPISSSAHLNLFPWVLGWGKMPESFDLALHIGTLLAIVIFFFKDWINLISGGIKKVLKKQYKDYTYNGMRYCLWYIHEHQRIPIKSIAIVPYYYEEAKNYYRWIQNIKKSLNEYSEETNEKVITKQEVEEDIFE